MKRSLRDSVNKKDPAETGSDHAGKLPDDLSALADRYRGMSEPELLNALLKETRKRKAEGSYDPAAVRSGVDSLLPMLNEEQKRKLFAIISRMDQQ